MNDSKKSQTPPPPAGTPGAAPSLENIKETALLLQRKWTKGYPERKKIAQETQDADDRKAAKLAIMFHQEKGLYPWEVPEDHLQVSQREWLDASGISKNEMTEDRIQHLKRLIEEENQKNKENGR
jgi:hypothetical protein